MELPGSSVPKRKHFFPPRGPSLTSENHSPSQSQRKGNPSKGIGPSAAAPGFLFLLTNYVRGKNAYFSKPKTNKNTNQNPKQTISLEISVDEMSQSQRHSPGTIPALRGSLHLPFYKKTTKQSC